MQCISLWQPWASLLVHGKKRVETRSWFTLFRGPLLIHASKKWSMAVSDLAKTWPFDLKLRDMGAQWFAGKRGRLNLPFGAIVGQVTMTECIRTEDAIKRWSIYEDGAAETYAEEIELGDYTAGRFAWLCQDFKAFKNPIPCVGRQGFFDVPASVIRGAT